jgi:uncharacterized protein (TIGR02678 family)
MNDDARDAARGLLRSPLIVAALEPDEHRRIRRHADELVAMFRKYLGYRLAIDARLARLYKAGLGDDRERPIVVRNSKAPFSPRDYTYLALVCSVLFATSQQILFSGLVVDVEQAAAEAGIDLDQANRSERLGLVHAVRRLIDWGALVEVDGSVTGYAEGAVTEALLTVERDVVRELLATTLRDVSTPAELLRNATEVAPEAIRHRVRRRIVECPVVILADLPEAERSWLRPSQRREAQLLEENFGLRLEIRSEGVAALDPADELTDVFFPRDGTVAQAALLTIAALVDGIDDTSVPSAPIEAAALEETVASLLRQHERHWSKDYHGRPDRLRADVEELLCAMGVARRAPGGGLNLLAVAARYAPEPVERSARVEALSMGEW